MAVHWSKDGNTFVHCIACSTTVCANRTKQPSAGCVSGTKMATVKTKVLMKNEVSS